MTRYFNTEGLCIPDEHYMVRLDDRLEKIKRLYVKREKYFVINRGKQYGKTTTLRALKEYLKDEYLVVSLDFQGISTEEYRDEYTFTRAFKRMFAESFKRQETTAGDKFKEFLDGQEQRGTLSELFTCLSGICAACSRPIVLMIDEVDSASNNQVFIDFLAQLRQYYLNKEEMPTFQSVILAGVYDIKNLKLKIRPNEEHQYNSPWNIAASFDINMSFSAKQIAEMLEEYEADSQTGMDTAAIAEEIFQYTSGYPYLVSAICKTMDERLPEQEAFEDTKSIWSRHGIAEAVKLMLKKNVSLFDSMIRQLDEYKELRRVIERILFQGKPTAFSPAEKYMNLECMFGFLKEKNGNIVIANRIFEMYLLDLFMAKASLNSEMFSYGQVNKNQFVHNERLNMERVLEKFVEYFTDIYGDNDEKFVETYGRKFFLLYLKPIINGKGNYYVEAQTRDARRTDVIVDYAGEQFIVEMKIWHGNEYNERGEQQLTEYLDYYHQKKGYMLSFNFNKQKETGVRTVTVGDKVIVEAVV